MIPLVLPGLRAGTGAVLVTEAGGHAARGSVTSTDITQPALLVPQALPPGMGLVFAAKFPMLKKIQSLATPGPAPLALKNSVTGEHAPPSLFARPTSGVAPFRTPAKVKLS